MFYEIVMDYKLKKNQILFTNDVLKEETIFRHRKKTNITSRKWYYERLEFSKFSFLNFLK